MSDPNDADPKPIPIIDPETVHEDDPDFDEIEDEEDEEDDEEFAESEVNDPGWYANGRTL